MIAFQVMACVVLFFAWLALGVKLMDGEFTKCAVSHCHSRRDPRCRGKNCTKHCADYCAGACLLAEKKSATLTVLRGGK